MQTFQKTNIFYSLIHTLKRAYLEVRNVSFSENFVFVSCHLLYRLLVTSEKARSRDSDGLLCKE